MKQKFIADLSSGIAARRKLRQEQREKELAEKLEAEKKNDVSKRPIPIIHEPTPSASENQEEKEQQGQTSSPSSRLKVAEMSNDQEEKEQQGQTSSPSSRLKVAEMSNGDSSGQGS